MTTNPIPGTPAEPAAHRLFTLENSSGMTVTISERGGALRSWRAPDRYHRMAEVLLTDPGRPGAAGAGPTRWQGSRAEGGVTMALKAAGGAADMLIHYRLDDDGRLAVDYRTTAGAPCALEALAIPCFHLNDGQSEVGDHMLQIDADYYVEVDARGAPVGVAAVGGTPFDFRQPAAIGPRLHWTDTQLLLAGGFDHCFYVRNHFAGGQGVLREVARVFDPGSGRRLQVYTTEAALRVRSSQPIGGDWGSTPAGPPRRRGGIGFEAHARPSLMSAAWPRVMLYPGQVYRQTTVYRLSLQDSAAGA